MSESQKTLYIVDRKKEEILQFDLSDLFRNLCWDKMNWSLKVPIFLLLYWLLKEHEVTRQDIYIYIDMSNLSETNPVVMLSRVNHIKDIT